MTSQLPIICAVCGKIVAADAATCPACGTAEFNQPIPIWIPVLSIVVVAAVSWLIYGFIFRGEPVQADFPALTQEESRLFSHCISEIRRIDPSAVVLPRPDVDRGAGLLVGWPYGGERLVVNGMRTSGSCSVSPDGRVEMLMVGDKVII